MNIHIGNTKLFLKSELELFKRRLMKTRTKKEKAETQGRIYPSFVTKFVSKKKGN